MLRRMLKDSPARQGVIVSDNYLQGMHLDVDIDNRNAGSLTWASRGTPWTDVTNITYNKLSAYIGSCYNEGLTEEECKAELNMLFAHYRVVDPGCRWRLPTQQTAQGGSFALLFAGNKPHRGDAMAAHSPDRVVRRVALHSHTESPLLVAARTASATNRRSAKANKVALEKTKRSLETGVVADISYVVSRWYAALSANRASKWTFIDYARQVARYQ